MSYRAQGEKPNQDPIFAEVSKNIRLARVLFDKCELLEAKGVLEDAFVKCEEHPSLKSYWEFKKAGGQSDKRSSIFKKRPSPQPELVSSALRLMTEIVAGLLRIAGEARNSDEVARLDQELDHLMAVTLESTPPMAWYCKGVVSAQAGQFRKAQIFAHKYLKAVRDGWDKAPEVVLTQKEATARAYLMIAIIFEHRGFFRRAKWLVEQILSHPEYRELPVIRGTCLLTLGKLSEKRKQFDQALEHYQQAHGIYLSSHNWYYHLYLLFAYARISRVQNKYAQAYWYLDLVEKASESGGLGFLQHEVAKERDALKADAVDLLIDSKKGIIRTREKAQVTVRKQYILLNILEALTEAHNKRVGEDPEHSGATNPDVQNARGLSKAEIIEKVWKEKYKPQAHDNKLYYNINRLRKLIEPDFKQPQYLLNWREGYRLAPGIKVQIK